MHAIVHPADIQDRDGGGLVMATLFGLYPFLLKIYADGGYQGPVFQSAVKAAIESYPGATFEFAELVYPAVAAAISLGGNPDDLKTFIPLVTEQNVILGVQVLQEDPELQGLLITGGVYDLATSQVNIPEVLTQ